MVSVVSLCSLIESRSGGDGLLVVPLRVIRELSREGTASSRAVKRPKETWALAPGSTDPTQLCKSPMNAGTTPGVLPTWL
jgi:hypothetical protein